MCRRATTRCQREPSEGQRASATDRISMLPHLSRPPCGPISTPACPGAPVTGHPAPPDGLPGSPWKSWVPPTLRPVPIWVIHHDVAYLAGDLPGRHDVRVRVRPDPRGTHLADVPAHRLTARRAAPGLPQVHRGTTRNRATGGRTRWWRLKWSSRPSRATRSASMRHCRPGRWANARSTPIAISTTRIVPGPARAPNYGCRSKPEHETAIENADVLLTVLTALGAEQIISFEKQCVNYRFTAQDRDRRRRRPGRRALRAARARHRGQRPHHPDLHQRGRDPKAHPATQLSGDREAAATLHQPLRCG